MSKNTDSEFPPTGGGESAARGGGAEGFGPLPRPNVSVPVSGENPAAFSEEGVKGIVMNPVYAGVGEYPRMIPDAQWIANARRLLAEDGPDQFLVNLLYVLRRSFGCVEWDGNLPRDRN